MHILDAAPGDRQRLPSCQGSRTAKTPRWIQVKSSVNPISSQTYVFSPLLEGEDNSLIATEALHQRKLFVAHILFGHEKALAGRGVVRDPVVMVESLLRKGWVGPASNIESDYHLLEAAGIVQVEEVGGGRALLKLVKREIVEGGLGWLRQTASGEGAGAIPNLLRAPGAFVTPERDEQALETLRANRQRLDALVEALLRAETLDAAHAYRAAGLTPPAEPRLADQLVDVVTPR